MLLFLGVAAATATNPPAAANPCRGSGPSAKLPFCDSTKPLDLRVGDLMSRLTIAEKITQLTTGNGVNGAHF